MMNGTPANDPFTGFRVVAKRRESETITSFELAPPDEAQVPGFVPGQFLVVRLPTGNGHGPILRNYSISSSPHEGSRLRITVKREPPPADRADLRTVATLDGKGFIARLKTSLQPDAAFTMPAPGAWMRFSPAAVKQP